MAEITILDIVLGCFTIIGGTFGAVCGAIAIAEEEEQNRNGFFTAFLPCIESAMADTRLRKYLCR